MLKARSRSDPNVPVNNEDAGIAIGVDEEQHTHNRGSAAFAYQRESVSVGLVICLDAISILAKTSHFLR